jgi:hypothetical protein
MNTNLLQFSDAAINASLPQLHPGLGHQLKQVTKNFAALTKSAAEASINGDEDSGEPTSEVVGEAHVVPKPQAPQLEDIGWGYSTPVVDAARQNDPKPSTHEPRERECMFQPMPTMPNAPYRNDHDSSLVRMRAPVRVGQVMDQAVSWSSTNTDEHQPSDQLPFGLINIPSRHQYSQPDASLNPQIYNVRIPTPDNTPPMKRLPTPPYFGSISTKTLAAPWTYSHDETTFARRLTRAALEAGFHLLSSAHQRPAALNHVFRLSIPYTDIDQLRHRFKSILARGTDEELDSWDSPFIHLGGAGTHYPRRDAQGNVVARPNAWTVRRIGPLSSNMVRAENTLEPSRSYDLNVDLTGFEGEWFDSFDVEGYLEQEKGCRIDPKSSFAEVLIDVDEDDHNIASNAFRIDYSRSPSQGTLSDTPSFSGGSSSSSSLSATNTPPNDGATSNSINSQFPQPNVPLNQDMGMSTNTNFATTDYGKFDYFGQPLGLDLAPGFDLNLSHTSNFPQINFDGNVDMGALGLDLMSGTANLGTRAEQMPVVRQKRKKAALVDVSKLVEGECSQTVC